MPAAVRERPRPELGPRHPSLFNRASTGVRIWSCSWASLSPGQRPWPQGLHDLPLVSAYAGVNCIPALTYQLHLGLIAHGEHLTHSWSCWTEDSDRQRGWAPEVTLGELIPGESAIKLWTQKRQQGWRACSPQWIPPQPPRACSGSPTG